MSIFLLLTDGQTDSHSDYCAHLLVVHCLLNGKKMYCSIKNHTLYTGDSLSSTVVNSVYPDKMHNAGFHQDLHYLLGQIRSSEEEIQ